MVMRHTARIVGFHDAVRFAERERLADHHPAFAHNPGNDDADTSEHEVRAVALRYEHPYRSHVHRLGPACIVA